MLVQCVKLHRIARTDVAMHPDNMINRMNVRVVFKMCFIRNTSWGWSLRYTSSVAVLKEEWFFQGRICVCFHECMMFSAKRRSYNDTNAQDGQSGCSPSVILVDGHVAALLCPSYLLLVCIRTRALHLTASKYSPTFIKGDKRPLKRISILRSFNIPSARTCF